MNVTGTVTATVNTGAANDDAGNPSTASTSTDNLINYDATGPTVTLNQASGQTDPTNASPINFTVVFSESVTGLTGSDIGLAGTANPTTATVSGDGTTYNVAVSGMSVTGTVTATVNAGGAIDEAGNSNTGSTSNDNGVVWDGFAPIYQSVTGASGTKVLIAKFSENILCSTAAKSDFLATVNGSPTAVSSIACSGATDPDIEVTITRTLPLAGGDVVVLQLASPVSDQAGNNAATPTNRSTTIDADRPSVTINQATDQKDPTNTSPINFTTVFSEPVTGFTADDVRIGGTANPVTATVTGSGATYNVAVSGMSVTGTVTATVVDMAASDSSGNNSTASTSTDNLVNYDATGPTVTINQASGQLDPTNSSPVNFTVVFSEDVTGLTGSDIALGGTSSPTTATVTGSDNRTYNVAVSGMSTTGTVTASIPAGSAADLAANGNAASTSTDNLVNYDATGPTVTINQAAGQVDPTNSSPVNFTVVFSEAVTGLTPSDIALGGTANPTTAEISGGETTYNVAVSGMSTTGTVTASIPAGSAIDLARNGNAASTSTDNVVSYDVTGPGVTINQASGQPDPTNASPINFTVVFSEAVAGFTRSGLTLGGTANPTTAAITGGPATYNVAVSGMSANGTVTATVNAGAANDTAGNASTASTSTDNVVTYDAEGPTVTLNQASGQLDPTNASPINFRVEFSEEVSGFTPSDVGLGGTANPTTAAISGGPTIYTVAVSGMSGNGTVTATVKAGAVSDGLGNPSTASTSTDDQVTYDVTSPSVTVNQASGQTDPTRSSPINFTVVFSEPVFNFVSSDVNVTGTAGATSGSVSGSGTTYNVAVSSMTGSGTVSVTVSPGVANDEAGSPNLASTSTDNVVTYDVTLPVFQSVTATGGSAVVNALFSEPILCTTVATTDFLASVNGSLTTLVNSVSCDGVADDSIALTLSEAPLGGHNVAINLVGAVTDRAGNQAASVQRTGVATNQIPTITVTGGPADQAVTNDSTPDYSGQAADPDGNVSDILVSLDSGGFTSDGTTCATCPSPNPSWTFTPTSTLADGTHVIVFRSVDNAGALSAGVTRTVTVDTNPPDFTSVSATGGSNVLIANFDEPVLCSSVEGEDFLAAVGGFPVVVTSATCTGTSDATIELTLASVPARGDAVAVTLAGTVSDPAGNAAPAPTTKSTTAA